MIFLIVFAIVVLLLFFSLFFASKKADEYIECYFPLQKEGDPMYEEDEEQ